MKYLVIIGRKRKHVFDPIYGYISSRELVKGESTNFILGSERWFYERIDEDWKISLWKRIKKKLLNKKLKFLITFLKKH